MPEADPTKKSSKRFGVLVLPAALILAALVLLARFHPASGPAVTSGSAESRSPAGPVPLSERRVLIVSIDGLRPDLLVRADAPHIVRLLDSASYTFWAQTVELCCTLPAHVSMITGVKPERHGVTWNHHVEEAYPSVPTLFALAKRAKLSTALAVGKTKFVALTPPETLDWKFQPTEEPVADAAVAERAVVILRDHRPRVFFVHLPGVDRAGHAHGWGTPPQLRAVGEADAALGHLLQAVDDLHLRGVTLVILTSDHGGAGLGHSASDPRSRHVPWIAAGPGVREGFDLTAVPGLSVSSEDTFATACYWLGLELPEQMDGKAVKAIFKGPGSLHPLPAPEASSFLTPPSAP